MRVVRLCQLGLAAAFALVGIFGAGAQARAQDRARVEVVPNLPHSGGIASVVFSPDGTRALSGAGDKTLKLWDAVSRQLIRTFEGHSNTVSSVAFSPNGTRVLSGSLDKTLKLWNSVNGRLIRTFEGHSAEVRSVAFSPDGTTVLSGSVDKTLKLWDVASGQLIRTFEGHSAEVRSVAFSPESTRVLSGSADKTLKLWDAASGQLIRTFEGHSQAVLSAAFSPDGTRVLSGSQDKTLKLWDAASGQLIRTFEGHSQAVLSAVFSPDGMRVLSGSQDKTLKLWDAASGHLIRTFQGHFADVASVAFSPDGVRVLSGSQDKTLKLWDAASGHLIPTFEAATGSVYSVAFSPDGTRVLSGSGDKTLKLRDAASGQLIRTFEGHSDVVLSVAFSPDGTRVLSGSWDKTLKLWDAASGQQIRAFGGHAAAVYSVAFSPDGTRVLSGSHDRTLKLWDAASGQLIRTFEGPSNDVWSVAISPDGTRVLSDQDKRLKLWDAASGQLIRTFEGHSRGVWSVAFSPDGTRVVSGSWDKTLKLWDAANGQLIRTFEGHSNVVSSVAFSPDGTRVLSGSSDTTLRLWDAASGQLIRTLEGHSAAVWSVAFSPDGTRVLSGSGDGTVRIWDARTGQLLASLFGARSGHWVAMTPAGFFAASGKGTEMLAIVRGLEAYSIMQFYDHLHRPDLVEELLKGDPEGKYKDASRRLSLETILDSGPAPRIELLPKRGEKSGETVKLAVRLVDEGGGIGPKVIWRVNGRTQGTTAAPLPRGPLTLGDYLVMEQTLTVDPSTTSEVEVIAYNGKGLLATPPLHFKVDAWGSMLQERPRLFVLAMGVDKYARPDWQLRYAAKDASAFAEAIKAVAAAKVDGKALYADIQVKTLLDEEVNERDISAEFDRLARIVKARDVFVLFVGGHGRSIAGEGWFYIPQDFDLAKGHTIEKDTIGPGKLAQWLAEVPAQKSLIVLDACESGASEAFRGGDRTHETVMAQLEHATGTNTIAAAPAGKAAYEGYNGHGVLTWAILEALNRPEGADARPVSVFGLAAHISLKVPDITQREFGIRQQPRFKPTGDDFSLGLSQAVLKDLPAAIPTQPTHVNPEALQVFKDAGGKGGVVLQLQPFTSVTVIKSERGWAHIGRDGKALGYVPEGQLKKLN